MCRSASSRSRRSRSAPPPARRARRGRPRAAPCRRRPRSGARRRRRTAAIVISTCGRRPAAHGLVERVTDDLVEPGLGPVAEPVGGGEVEVEGDAAAHRVALGQLGDRRREAELAERVRLDSADDLAEVDVRLVRHRRGRARRSGCRSRRRRRRARPARRRASARPPRGAGQGRRGSARPAGGARRARPAAARRGAAGRRRRRLRSINRSSRRAVRSRRPACACRPRAS